MSRPGIEPLVEELVAPPDVAEVFSRLAHLPHCVFLDSAMRDPRLGRYSFLAASPFEFVEYPVGEDALDHLAQALSRFSMKTLPDLPPFQGGAAGVLSYDLGRSLERIPPPRADEFGVPVLAVGLYDVVVAFDHVLDQAWIFSSGLPERSEDARRRRARRRLEEFKRLVLDERKRGREPFVRSTWRTGSRQMVPDPFFPDGPVAPEKLTPQSPVAGFPGLTSNFSEAEYLTAVQRAIDYIHAGDVFQVNLAQRLLHPSVDDSVSLYQRLRQRNPAPFAGYFDLGEFQVVSASPERFLQVRGGQVEARPIKGTRQRSTHGPSDERHAAQLQASEKDRAENVMIVDLLRNDLSRVCEADSVRVTELCSLEQYEYVQHLVSSVRGRLREGAGCIDLIRAAFPGGSITGAPKIRAMEIIAELEPNARGAYCGSLGYFGFDGSMDLSILIRTITTGRGWWQAPVGGGIVAQSQPAEEYEETWHKAEGLLRAFRP